MHKGSQSPSSGDAATEAKLTLHWYVAGKLQYQITIGWGSHLPEVIDILLEEGNKEVQDLVYANRLMLWFWKTKNSESKATVVSDDQGFQKLLKGTREDGLTILYGKAHTQDDERSPPPG